MTNEQILKKAIEKAVKNGYEFIGKPDSWEVNGGRVIDSKQLEIRLFSMYKGTRLSAFVCWKCLIFSHDFAEAFVKYLKKETKFLIADDLEVATKDFLREIFEHIVIEKKGLQYLKKFL